MKKIPFFKFSGAGNDFVLIDKKIFPEFDSDPGLINRMTRRGKGIGADGLLLISDTENYDFRMQYFNADGSEGFLCANGARCSVKYAAMSGRIQEKAEFICCGKNYSAKINVDGTVTLNLPDAAGLETGLSVPVGKQMVNATFIDTGARHIVINSKDLAATDGILSENNFDNLPVYELGRKIRNLNQFAPEGVNVNFIEIRDDQINIRTYEKGVEDETLACGTGSVAAAIVSFLQNKVKTPAVLIPKSQDKLIVKFDYINQSIKNISLTGPAELIFAGDYINNQ